MNNKTNINERESNWDLYQSEFSQRQDTSISSGMNVENIEQQRCYVSFFEILKFIKDLKNCTNSHNINDCKINFAKRVESIKYRGDGLPSEYVDSVARDLNLELNNIDTIMRLHLERPELVNKEGESVTQYSLNIFYGPPCAGKTFIQDRIVKDYAMTFDTDGFSEFGTFKDWIRSSLDFRFFDKKRIAYIFTNRHEWLSTEQICELCSAVQLNKPYTISMNCIVPDHRLITRKIMSYVNTDDSLFLMVDLVNSIARWLMVSYEEVGEIIKRIHDSLSLNEDILADFRIILNQME